MIKRVHVQMDHAPIISLYDSDKGMALNVSNRDIEQFITGKAKSRGHMKSCVQRTMHIDFKAIGGDIYII